jgi:hypothetical protein
MEDIIEKYNEQMLWKGSMVKVTQKGESEDKSIYHGTEGKLMGLN